MQDAFSPLEPLLASFFLSRFVPAFIEFAILPALLQFGVRLGGRITPEMGKARASELRAYDCEAALYVRRGITVITQWLCWWNTLDKLYVMYGVIIIIMQYVVYSKGTLAPHSSHSLPFCLIFFFFFYKHSPTPYDMTPTQAP